MLYLFTALYAEAQPFIEKLHLEKALDSAHFQQFYNEAADIRLTITGVGEIAAAAAVAGVCAEHKPKENDFLLNVGVCARTAEGGGVFLCNKIVEQATGKTFYPDILYRHDFCEETVVTGMRLCNVGAESLSDLGGALYDMEAAAVYQSGAYFFGPHQMIFLKIVSDSGAADGVSQKQVTRLVEAHQDALLDFVGQIALLSAAHESAPQKDRKQQEKERLFEKLCADMHCSKTMRISLEQHIHYWSLVGADYVGAIQAMYREGLLPCKDKRDGKQRFEELKRRLF